MTDINLQALDRELKQGAAELLYRLEERGWIKGTWVEKSGERRRRFYRLTETFSACWLDSARPGTSSSRPFDR